MPLDGLTAPQTTFAYCNSCDNRIRRCDADTAHYCEECDHWSCHSCGPCGNQDARGRRGRRNSSGIYPWNYRPRHFKPKGRFPAEPLLGVELEVGGRRAELIVEAVHDTDPDSEHLYLKEDGSITGVEIVTHPMTLQWAREWKDSQGRPAFNTMLAELRRLRCRMDDGFGLHVHVSRNAFQHRGKQSRTHQMMWLLFMYRNVDELEALARRTSREWASFRKPAPGELRRKARGVVWADDSRYVAVNCNNDRTYELRFFKSTTKEREFWAALEFADASVAYTKGLHVQDVLKGQALAWDQFLRWAQKQDYPNLCAEIVAQRRARQRAQRQTENIAATLSAEFADVAPEDVARYQQFTTNEMRATYQQLREYVIGPVRYTISGGEMAAAPEGVRVVQQADDGWLSLGFSESGLSEGGF